MAVLSAQVTVTTTATKLSATEGDSVPGQSLGLKNTGAVTVYLGGAGVTTANGYVFAAGDVLGVDIQLGDALYGVVASGTCTVAVLEVGV